MSTESSIYGLTHKCDDPDCHVKSFVKTLSTMSHPSAICGLRDCPVCASVTERILRDIERPTETPDGDA